VTRQWGGQEFGQPPQARILEIVALLRKFVLPDREPYQGRGAALPGDQVQGERGLVVMIEIGPVHRHQNAPALADLVRHPTGETVPHVDAGVTQHPVDLLDGVLGDQTSGLRERLADHCDRQRRGLHHPEGRAGQ